MHNHVLLLSFLIHSINPFTLPHNTPLEYKHPRTNCISPFCVIVRLKLPHIVVSPYLYPFLSLHQWCTPFHPTTTTRRQQPLKYKWCSLKVSSKIHSYQRIHYPTKLLFFILSLSILCYPSYILSTYSWCSLIKAPLDIKWHHMRLQCRQLEHSLQVLSNTEWTGEENKANWIKLGTQIKRFTREYLEEAIRKVRYNWWEWLSMALALILWSINRRCYPIM